MTQDAACATRQERTYHQNSQRLVHTPVLMDFVSVQHDLDGYRSAAVTLCVNCRPKNGSTGVTISNRSGKTAYNCATI